VYVVADESTNTSPECAAYSYAELLTLAITFITTMGCSAECSNDDAFGPAVFGAREDFDFTLQFENVVLLLLPSSIFAVLAVLRAWQLCRGPATASNRTSRLLVAKLVRAKAPA